MKRDYSRIQNGSDIRGIALACPGGPDVNISREDAAYIGKGFVIWLARHLEKDPCGLKIAVGTDSRVTGESLKAGIFEGLSSSGAIALDSGLSSTPAMFMSTVFMDYKCDGAVMITASHLPYERNGFKFFIREGGLNKEEISELLRIAESDETIENFEREHLLTCMLASSEKENKPVKVDLMEAYSKFLRVKIKDEVQDAENYHYPLTGLKIVVDAGNGAGGFYAGSILEPLGADVSGSQFLEPDGYFPNHPANPEDKEAMESLSRRVVETGADLGIIFDTDVDRAAAVDGQGREISRNKIVALAAAMVAETNPKTAIVTDSITSNHLTDFIENRLGLKHIRFKRGYKNVINKALELNGEGKDCQLAIETSGHAAFKENFFLDDGAYLATKIVITAAKLAKEGKTIDSMIVDLKEPRESVEIRLDISGESFSRVADRILSDMKLWVTTSDCVRRAEDGSLMPTDEEGCCLCHCGMSLAEPNFEGVRIDFGEGFGNGWCLLRKSLHDPIMPLNIESDDEGGCKLIAGRLKNFLEGYKEVDLSKLDI